MSNTPNPNDYQLVLIDDKGNVYTEDEIRMMWPDFDGKAGNKRFPKVWEYDENGNVKTEGATVAISYLNNDHTKPIVTGCIENLGSQQNYMPGMGTNLDTLNAETNINDNEDFRVTRTISPDGDMFIELENKHEDKAVNYHLSVKGSKANIYINSEGNTYIGNDHNQIRFEDNKIFIGSREYAGKAEEVGINAERIILGNSTFYHPEVDKKVDFPISQQTRTEHFPSSLAGHTDNIKHQWAVLGETLVYLMKKMMETWWETKYQGGNTICTVSYLDKQKMYDEVYSKLPRMLSSCVSLVNKPVDPKVES